MMTLRLLLSFFLCFWSITAADNLQTPLTDAYLSAQPRRIAIIGGGAGGSSAAYQIRKFLDASRYDIPVEIDIFDSGSRIGGRTTTVNALDDDRYPVELGASIFVPINYILYNATKEFGFNVSTKLFNGNKNSNYDLGVWDGTDFVFKQSSGGGWWRGYWDIAKLLWKYGTSPIRTQNLMKDAVGRFLKFYDEPHFPFISLAEVVTGMGLLDFTGTTGAEVLSKAGIGEAFAHDIIQASTRVNYAQNLDQIHGLETMCCMATEGAMAVEGGNWQIFNEAVKRSEANVYLNTTVAGVIKDTNTQNYFLALNNKDSGRDTLPKPYDNVILAAPYQFSGINFEPEPDYLPMSIDYVSLHVTLFTSRYQLSPSYFGVDNANDIPSTVLTTLPPNTNSTSPEPHPFYSISTLRELELGKDYPYEAQFLYKIFSPAPLNATFLSSLLDFPHTPNPIIDPLSSISREHVSWIYEKKWHSYPYEVPRTFFEQIKLDSWRGSGKGVWYTSGIESFISTMETSALMGMNVARLLVTELEWHHDLHEERLKQGRIGKESESEAEEDDVYDKLEGLMGKLKVTLGELGGNMGQFERCLEQKCGRAGVTEELKEAMGNLYGFTGGFEKWLEQQQQKKKRKAG